MISVVIPNYNRRESVLQVLESVYAQEGVSFEVILVDDCSQDSSVEAIRARFPRTLILAQSKNRGPAVCRNLGILRASGDIIVGLDSDATLVDKGALLKVQELFTELPTADGFAFRLLTPDGKSEDVDRWWHPLPVHRFSRSRFSTYYFSGTAYAFRTSAVRKAGLFPEIFFMHYEEVELAYRILDNGGSIIYCPELVALHHENVVSRRSEARLFYKPRNQILLTLKSYPLLRGVVFLVPRLIYGFLRAIAGLHLSIFFRAIYSALKSVPLCWSQRKVLKTTTWAQMAAIRKGL